MVRVELKIEGMSCDHCADRVQKKLATVEGVTAATVGLDPARAIVEMAGASIDALLEAVAAAGYRASLAGEPGA